MYKQLIYAFALVYPIASLVNRAYAVDPPADPDAGLAELFNGKDLSGWIAEGTKSYDVDGVERPVWTARDGVIQCAGKGFGFLRYNQTFDDFELRLEFRFSHGCNSGVGIRHGTYTGETNTRPSRAGFEI